MSNGFTAQMNRLSFGPSRFSPVTAWVIGVAGLLFVVAVMVWVFRQSADAAQYPVNEVEVLGTLDYTDRDDLRELVLEQVNNGFYRLDVDRIQRDIVSLPWVAEAHIRRVWPDRLSIEVVEHEPAARWNDNALISKRYELFHPPQLKKDSIQRAEWQAWFSQFPQLTGGAGRHETVLTAFRTMQDYMLPYQVRVESLLEDDRQSQTLLLDNNVTVRLGVDNIQERLDRFVSVFARLVEPLVGQSAVFDMRYANGFSMTNTDVALQLGQ